MQIEGNTNVRSQRFGAGSVDGLGRELGRFVVATMDVPWRIVKERLGGTPETVIFVESMEVDVLERQLAEIPPCDTFVGIGGGQAIDLAKYFSWRRGAASIPTVPRRRAFARAAGGGVRRSSSRRVSGDHES
ncbi:MAG: hypothetical protein U1D30_04300 [Planctomycetota bacterium]